MFANLLCASAWLICTENIYQIWHEISSAGKTKMICECRLICLGIFKSKTFKQKEYIKIFCIQETLIFLIVKGTINIY